MAAQERAMQGAAHGVAAADAAAVQAETRATRRFSALHNRNFALLWVGMIISNSGSWMQLVAQGVLVYNLTNSPLYLGIAAVARAVPMIVLPPFGGVVADRVPRLKLLKITQSVSFGIALVFGALISTGLINMWEICLLGFLAGAVNAFDQPTRQALLPDLVRREDMTNAIALNSVAWQGAALFGPTLAGATVAVTGIAGAFYANAVSFLAVVAALFLMRGVPERSVAARRRGLFDDLSEGLRYVGASRLVFTLLALATITSIFGRSYQQLLPVFAKDVLGVGTSGLGLMMSAPGAGTIVGAAAVGWLGDVERKGAVLFGGMLAFSATLVAFCFSHSFLVSLALLFVGGAAMISFSTMLTTMVQLTAPPHMRGRVMALITVTMQGFNPIGALITGALATVTGTPAAVALSAMVVGFAACAAFLGAPVVRSFSLADEQPVPA